MRKQTFPRSFFVAVLTLQLLPARAVADCQPEWLSGPDRQIPGVGGTVKALTTWDPDGAGPEPELVIVGGHFNVAGDVIASNIATWDGTEWRPLGTGTNSSVTALTVYNGELITGGSFTAAGEVEANYIARWDGTQWRPLASGMNDAVYALNVYNGELIAGGYFTTAGGGAEQAPSQRLAKTRLGSSELPLKGAQIDQIVPPISIDVMRSALLFHTRARSGHTRAERRKIDKIRVVVVVEIRVDRRHQKRPA